MSEHALLSASGAAKWINCPGSLLMEKDEPNTSSAAATEGTLAHELAAAMLLGYEVAAHGGNEEMLPYVTDYAIAVQVCADGGQLFVERRVDYSDYVGVPDSYGTADAIVLQPGELQVHDLKYGRGVQVDAETEKQPSAAHRELNEQLMLYALGAYDEFSLIEDIQTIRIVVHQPRLNHISYANLTVPELMEFAERVKPKAEQAIRIYKSGELNASEDLNPGEKQCRWCRAKAKCPALSNRVLTAVADDFVDLDADISDQLSSANQRVQNADNLHLANCLKAVPLIDMWVKAVEAKAQAELSAGRDVPGFKLVEGRRGNRAWEDEALAEQTLKKMRLKKDDMYKLKLISPTDAEKLNKAGVLGPKQWPLLAKLITRPDGKPAVAPLSDKRPALTVDPAADFDNLDDETEDLI